LGLIGALTALGIVLKIIDRQGRETVVDVPPGSRVEIGGEGTVQVELPDNTALSALPPFDIRPSIAPREGPSETSANKPTIDLPSDKPAPPPSEWHADPGRETKTVFGLLFDGRRRAKRESEIPECLVRIESLACPFEQPVTFEVVVVPLGKPVVFEEFPGAGGPQQVWNLFSSFRGGGKGVGLNIGPAGWAFSLRASRFDEDAAPESHHFIGPNPFQLCTPFHVAGVRDVGAGRLYVNGKQQYGWNLPSEGWIGKSGSFAIGAFPNGHATFHGVITEARVSSVARYADDFRPAERLEQDNDTVALYHFDEGQGPVLHDACGRHHGEIVNAKWVKLPVSQDRETGQFLPVETEQIVPLEPAGNDPVPKPASDAP